MQELDYKNKNMETGTFYHERLFKFSDKFLKKMIQDIIESYPGLDISLIKLKIECGVLVNNNSPDLMKNRCGICGDIVFDDQEFIGVGEQRYHSTCDRMQRKEAEEKRNEEKKNKS